MNAREAEQLVAAADPTAGRRLEALDLEAMEADLLADIGRGQSPLLAVEPAHARRVGRPKPWLAAGVVGVAAVLALFLLFGSGGSGRPARAYGADLVRLAEASPLVLLQGPGWRVQNVEEHRTRAGIDGSMEFVTGKPIPYESIRISGSSRRPHESGMFPPAVRQRRVELDWRHGGLAATLEWQHKAPHPHGQRWLRLPVLGTTAQVDTRDEFFVDQGGPGNRQMLALWREDGYVLELRAAVPDLAGFEERLGWLTKVDQETWLEAMPAKVVKASDHDAAVREVLKGIPVPRTFTPARVPDEGLTTDRYQIGAQTTGTVACLWLRQWGAGRRSGDEAAVREADRAMASSRHWPILREMTKEGAWSQVLWEIAEWMPKGYFEWAGHKRDLLAHAEGLGCARMGLPLMPRKMKLQRERDAPPPPG